jgi:hypothetical protein
MGIEYRNRVKGAAQFLMMVRRVAAYKEKLKQTSASASKRNRPEQQSSDDSTSNPSGGLPQTGSETDSARAAA